MAIPAAATAADTQTSLVEDYNYPGADQIFTEAGIKLISGDGHIVLAKCPATGPDTVGLIQVHTTDRVGYGKDGYVCFRVTASAGHLSLKIPAVYEIRGDGLSQGQGHKLRAEVTTDAGQHTSVDVDPSGSTQVGIGTGGAATTLLQLDASPGTSPGGPAAPDGPYRFVAKLDSDGHGCTGALVDPQWVITAASCIPNFQGQAGPPAAPITVTVGATDLTSTTGRVAHVATIVPRADRDLVLAKLDVPVAGITPIPVAATAASTGETLTVAGYGRTATEWVPNLLHTNAFTAAAPTGSTVPVSSTTGVDTCRGDAGGPAFRTVNGAVQLVAITTASWQHGCLTETETRQGGTETRVDDLAAWIAQTRAANRDLHVFPLAAGVVWHNIRSANGTWQRLSDVGRDVSFVAATTLSTGDLAVATISGGSLSLNIGHPDGTWTGPSVIDNGITAVALAPAANGDLHVFPIAAGVVWHNILSSAGTWQRLDAVASGASSATATVMPNGDLALATISNGTVSLNIEHPNGSWTGPSVIDNGVTAVAMAATANGDLHVFPLAAGVVWHNIHSTNGTWQRLAEVGRNVSSVAATTLSTGDLYLATIAGGNVTQNILHPDSTWTGPTVIDNGGSVIQDALAIA